MLKKKKNPLRVGPGIIWSSVLGILALLGLWQAADTYIDYRRTIGEAEDRLMAQARVVDENLSAKLSIINLLFSDVNKMMNSTPRPADEEINKYLAYQDSFIPGVRTLHITDSSGRIILSDRKKILGIDASSRDYFLMARSTPDANHLIISPPFKSRFGNYVVNIVKPLTGKRGEFRGVVAATLDQEYFITLLKSLLFSPDNRILLVHTGGEIFLSMPDPFTGMKFDQPDLFEDGSQGGTRHSFTRQGLDAITGKPRIYAVVTTSMLNSAVERPLSVVVSRNRNAVLHAWRQQLAFQVFFFVLFMSVSIAITQVYLRRRSEREKAAEGLRRREEELKTLFALLPVGILIVDEDHRLIRANQAARKLVPAGGTESPEGGFWNRTYLRSDGTPLPPEEVPSMRALREQREVQGVEMGVVNEDQTTTWLAVSAAPMPGIGAAIVVADVTDRKKAEEERLKSHMLESIGILAGGVAHDFNNLLTVILANVNIVKSSLPQEQKEFSRLSDVEQICLMASDLSSRLLTFATGGDPEKKIVSMAALLRDTVSHTLKQSKIHTCFIVPDDLLPVAVDESLMKQVIVNLTNNAREAMPQGGTFTIRAENLSVSPNDTLPLREGVYVKISFHDTGAGIPAASVARVFDPYFSTKETYNQKGLGLGLAVCYSVIKSHEGLITLESEPGAGTVFYVYLPVVGRPHP